MFSIDNINKQSDKRWKAVADFFLYTLPLYQGAILALPLSDSQKMWISFAISVVVISLKGMSKLTAETNEPTN